jgi:hypothetical protein
MLRSCGRGATICAPVLTHANDVSFSHVSPLAVDEHICSGLAVAIATVAAVATVDDADCDVDEYL